MTTIVATTEGVYADSLCTYTVPFKVSKVTRIGNSVFGGAGDLDDLTRFYEWQRKGAKPKDAPSFDEAIDILEVCDDGIFLIGKKLIRLKIDQDVYTVGSGAQFAMGAIAAGASPKKAIEIAARLDNQTAPPVEFVKLKAR